jgi:hypothetical protein
VFFIIAALSACGAKRADLPPGTMVLGDKVFAVLMPKHTIALLTIRNADTQQIVTGLKNLAANEKRIIVLDPGNYVIGVNGFLSDALPILRDSKISLDDRGNERVKVEPTEPPQVAFAIIRSGRPIIWDIEIPEEKRLYNLTVNLTILNLEKIPVNQLSAIIKGPNVDQTFAFNKIEKNGNIQRAISSSQIKFLEGTGYTATILVNGNAGTVPSWSFKAVDDDTHGPELLNKGDTFYYRPAPSRSTIIPLKLRDQNGVDADFSHALINSEKFPIKSGSLKNIRNTNDYTAEIEIPAGFFANMHTPVNARLVLRDNDNDKPGDQSTSETTIQLIEGIVSDQSFEINWKGNHLEYVNVAAYDNSDGKLEGINQDMSSTEYNTFNARNRNYLCWTGLTNGDGIITLNNRTAGEKIRFFFFNNRKKDRCYAVETHLNVPDPKKTIPINLSFIPAKQLFTIEANVDSDLDLWRNAVNTTEPVHVWVYYEAGRESTENKIDFLRKNPKKIETENYNFSDTGISASIILDSVSLLSNINYILEVEFVNSGKFSMPEASPDYITTARSLKAGN